MIENLWELIETRAKQRRVKCMKKTNRRDGKGEKERYLKRQRHRGRERIREEDERMGGRERDRERIRESVVNNT